MLDGIGAIDSAHFNLSYFLIYSMKISENGYKSTLNNKNSLLRQKFCVGEGFINV